MMPRLLLLTDRSQLPLGRALARTITECVAAGATHVVVRELDEPAEARAALVDVVREAGGVPIAAHGPVGSCNAALLQLSAVPALHSVTRTPRYMSERGSPSLLVTPERASEAPAAGGSYKLLGASCHTPAEVHEAAARGADFATLSPFAATLSKPGYGPPVDPRAYAGLPIPTYALGGITPGNAAEALDHGAHGVAVMGAVMRAPDPAGVVRQLLEVLG